MIQHLNIRRSLTGEVKMPCIRKSTVSVCFAVCTILTIGWSAAFALRIHER